MDHLHYTDKIKSNHRNWGLKLIEQDVQKYPLHGGHIRTGRRPCADQFALNRIIIDGGMSARMRRTEKKQLDVFALLADRYVQHICQSIDQ